MTSANLSFWRAIGVVLSGAAAAQVIPIVGSLVLARIFAPAEFGQFAAWLSSASIAAVAMTGRYEMALVLEGTSERRRVGATATLVVIGGSAALLALCSIIIILLLPDGSVGGLPALMIALLVPTALLIAAAQTWQSWAASEARFSDLSTMRIAQATGITVLQIGAGCISPSAEALAVAHAVGVTLGISLAAKKLPLQWVRTEDLRAFWRRQSQFPVWSLPAGLISSGASQLPVLVVASRFGAEVAGLLALALRTLGAPTALLGMSVLDVFKVGAAKEFRELGQCHGFYVSTLKGLIIGSVVVSLPLLIFSESLFAVAFGEIWRGAGVIAVWLIPMFALRFVASPLSYMFFIAGRQRQDLIWQIALLAMTLASLTLTGSYTAALKFYSAGYSVLYIIYLWMSYRLSCGGPG